MWLRWKRYLSVNPKQGHGARSEYVSSFSLYVHTFNALQLLANTYYSSCDYLYEYAERSRDVSRLGGTNS